MLAYLTLNQLIDCVKPNVTFCICFTLAGFSGLAMTIVGNTEDDRMGFLFVALVIVARFGIATNYNLVYT